MPGDLACCSPHSFLLLVGAVLGVGVRLAVAAAGAVSRQQLRLELPVELLGLLDLNECGLYLLDQLDVTQEEPAVLLVEAEVGVGVLGHHLLEDVVHYVVRGLAAVRVLGCRGEVVRLALLAHRFKRIVWGNILLLKESQTKLKGGNE